MDSQGPTSWGDILGSFGSQGKERYPSLGIWTMSASLWLSGDLRHMHTQAVLTELSGWKYTDKEYIELQRWIWSAFWWMGEEVWVDTLKIHYIHVWYFIYITYTHDSLYALYTCMTFLKTKWNKGFKSERINGNRLLNVLRFIGVFFFQFWFLNSSLVVTKHTLYELNVLIFGKTYLQMILFYSGKCCKCIGK